jgi:hypothetical protein
MTTILTQNGVTPSLGILSNNYKTPKGRLLLEGRLWDFKIRESDIISQVSLRISDHRERTVGIWIFKHITDKPKYILALESSSGGLDGYGDILTIIDRDGKSLRYAGSDKHMQEGYGTYLLKQAEGINFGLSRSLIDNVFDPLEEQVKMHYAALK